MEESSSLSSSPDSSSSSALDLPEPSQRTYFSNVLVNQYASEVLDFSSQYGSDYSISYTALNITGRPSKYPDYGDFPETYALRTYGHFWNECPSSTKEFNVQNLPSLPSDDFIIIGFEQFVVPEKIIIFETYNPGAIVRIWAFTVEGNWDLLWEATKQQLQTSAVRSTYRKSVPFTPPIKSIKTPIQIIRLEFNHSHLDYFTEIDGVTLIGKKCNFFNINDYQTFKRNNPEKGPILKTLESIKFRPVDVSRNTEKFENFLINDLEKFIQELVLPSEETIDCDGNDKGLELSDLPFDILLKIFSYLDLVSLFKIGKTSKLMYDISTHPLLYSEVNLRPYWHIVNNDTICTLAKRTSLLKKLDMSWCGVFGSIDRTEFKKLIQQRGDTVTHLYLNSCKFLNASCLDTVGIVCDNLKELSLRNYSDPPIMNFSCVANLKNLERLDLFRTNIETSLLLTILENNPRLKHLNLAFGGISVNMDEVAIQISRTNTQLVSIDLWKSHSLSAIGIQALSLCPDLEEIDFGWCLREEALPGESLRNMFTRCTKLKKIFLAAIRGITDRDIENIANLCNNLEQLDLMGVLGISTEKCLEILMKCKKLKFLDLSFCENVDTNMINLWRESFNVDIKRSFVPTDFLN